MKQIKVLHISPDGVLFGTERHILSIVKNSDRIRFEHHVSVPREGSFTEELKLIGTKYHIGSRMPSKKSVTAGLFEKGGIFKLRKLLVKGDFDIVHTHLNSYGGLLSYFSGQRNLVHTRHGMFWTELELDNISILKRKFQKLKSGIFKKTIALSEIEKKVMVEKFNYDPEKIDVIYNGVTIGDITAKIDPKLSKYDLFETNDFIVGSIGRFERQKGYHLFVEAAAEVVKHIKNIKFVLIGKGSLRSSIESQINDLGLREHFLIFDYKENVFDYLHKFDIMVSSSLWEGIPYAILEAMALGRPTIAFTSSLSGVSEIIDSGKNGFLISDNYVRNLAELIINLNRDQYKLKIIGENSKKQIENKFSESNMIKKLESIYFDLTSKINSN